jgi:adenylate kinase
VRLALVGPPGSGKGTQAAALGRHLGVPVISSGELLRAAAANRRDLADRLARGELVPDDVVLALVQDALGHASSDGYIIDGFPRTRAQAEHVDAPPVDAVIHLVVPDDVARERIARRVGGRTDDAERATVERRLRQYHSDTEPLLDLYRGRGILRSVEADQKPEAVTADILRALDVDGS